MSSSVGRSLSQSQIEILKRFGSATLHEALGQAGALDSAIKPLDRRWRLAGPALTVETRAGDNLALHHAIAVARPGDVMVVDAKAFVECGLWGDILTLAARKAGVAGLVVDGSVRDTGQIIAMEFPVFARGISIKAAQKKNPGGIDVPVICGGVRIEPGDVVVGDGDGVVAIPRARLVAVLSASRKREADEDDLRVGIAEGRTTVDLLGLPAYSARKS
jgi:4-hydroxy-4-methyl-2-oxoglutarate aldolase